MDIITIATTETKARTVKAWFSDKAVWLHTEELQISVNPITLVRACKRLLDNFKATLEIDNDFERRASESIESNITAWFILK